MRFIRRGTLLIVLWLLAWGELSLVNIVSGALVAVALLAAFPLGAPAQPAGREHPLGLAKLAAYVVTQLVVANIVMTRTILDPRSPAGRAGIVRHRLAEPSEVTVTLMTSIISLSPGTMTVGVADDASEIAVHFFSLDEPAAAAAGLVRLEHLVTAAVASRARAPSASQPGGTR
jgi:multicomponent Na+:H+ antiporter subunit E